MNGAKLPIFILVTTSAVTLYGGFLLWRHSRQDAPIAYAFSSVDASPAITAPEGREPLRSFTLIDQDGNRFSTTELDGEVWVASVFFTACPTICRELNLQLAEMQKDPALRDVRFVSITCDPANDTPPRLAAYAASLGADIRRWKFCTGDMQLIERIGREMLMISVEGKTHSNRAVVFDREGNVRGRFITTDLRIDGQVLPHERDQMRSVLLECLKEPRPERKMPTPTAKTTTDDQVSDAVNRQGDDPAAAEL